MALPTVVLESVTGHAGTLVEHGQVAVSSGPEKGQWLVTSRQLIVAPDAVVGAVAGSAGMAV